jgi:hypothetical protein
LEIWIERVPTKSIPGLVDLEKAMAQCAEASLGENSEKAEKFFQAATQMLKRDYIDVLQIRDSNTLGVEGPCENGKPFFALLKATGQSKKGSTSTGSYGIGKFAPFTISELRTVFVSTVWKDPVKGLQHYVQGKAVLMSHWDEQKRLHRGTGFWGVVEGCQPVTIIDDLIPDWLLMCEEGEILTNECLGTQISIVGFVANKGWQKVLTANIVENFFGAIYRNELKVHFQNGPSIDRDTLTFLTSDTDIRASDIDQDGQPEKFNNVAHYLRALGNTKDVIIERSENQHLGECELRIVLGENLPKRVAVLRNGMLITESLIGLKRFGNFKEFAAVLECSTAKGLALLRAMEPPKHDAFEPDRLSPDRRSQGRTALRELAKWVREMLERHAKNPVTEETNIDDLADFFGDEEGEGAKKVKGENPSGKILIKARMVKLKTQPAPSEVKSSATQVGDDETSDDAETGGFDVQPSPPMAPEQQSKTTTGKHSSQANSGNDKNSNASQHGPRLSAITNARVVWQSETSCRVGFTPLESVQLRLELQESGADTNFPLNVKWSSDGKVQDGCVSGISAIANQRVLLDIELVDPFFGTIKVAAYAI